MNLQEIKEPGPEPDPVFEVGQFIRCINPGGYDLTKGKVYTVTEYDFYGVVGNPYVTITDNHGRCCTCYSRRFEDIVDRNDQG